MGRPYGIFACPRRQSTIQNRLGSLQVQGSHHTPGTASIFRTCFLLSGLLRFAGFGDGACPLVRWVWAAFHRYTFDMEHGGLTDVSEPVPPRHLRRLVRPRERAGKCVPAFNNVFLVIYGSTRSVHSAYRTVYGDSRISTHNHIGILARRTRLQFFAHACFSSSSCICLSSVIYSPLQRQCGIASKTTMS